MRLNYSLDVSESIRQVRLPAPGVIPKGDAILLGWGYSNLEGYPPHYSDVLQSAKVPILEFEGLIIIFLILLNYFNI